MKGVLVFKDGRRVPMDPKWVGSIRHYVPSNVDGRELETVFVADAEVEDGDTIVYRETETNDVSEEYRVARIRIAENTARMLRKGLDS